MVPVPLRPAPNIGHWKVQRTQHRLGGQITRFQIHEGYRKSKRKALLFQPRVVAVATTARISRRCGCNPQRFFNFRKIIYNFIEKQLNLVKEPNRWESSVKAQHNIKIPGPFPVQRSATNRFVDIRTPKVTVVVLLLRDLPPNRKWKRPRV